MISDRSVLSQPCQTPGVLTSVALTTEESSPGSNWQADTLQVKGSVTVAVTHQQVSCPLTYLHKYQHKCEGWKMCQKLSRTKQKIYTIYYLTWQTFSFKDVAPIFPFTSTWEERLSFKPADCTFRDEERAVVTHAHGLQILSSLMDEQILFSWTIPHAHLKFGS